MDWFGLLCLTSLSTILQLYHGGQLYRGGQLYHGGQLYRGGQFQRWMKPEYLEKTTGLSQVTDKLDVVSSAPRLSGVRTHKVSGDIH